MVGHVNKTKVIDIAKLIFGNHKELFKRLENK